MLFTSPNTINDGTADHIYEYQGQIPDPKALVGRYFEPGAPVGSVSRINVKSDITSPTIERKLIQFTSKVADSNGDLKQVTWNLTVVYAKTHAVAHVVAIGGRVLNAVDAAILTKLCQGYV